MVQHGYIGRTIECGNISYTIVNRVIIATTNDVVPLVVERLKLSISTVSITEEIPVIVITHATSSKLEVAAGELSTLVIFLSRNAHVTFNTNLNLLEGCYVQSQLYVLLRQYFLTLCTEVIEAEVSRCIHTPFAIICA